MQDTLPLLLAGTLGAGAMLVLQPPPTPPACEPVELVRFVGAQPEIHIVDTTTFGRSTQDWLTQFEAAVEPAPEEEPTQPRRRRHVRW